MIQVARIAPDGSYALTDAWPGSAPDIAATAEGAVVAWSSTGQEDEGRREVRVRVVSSSRP